MLNKSIVISLLSLVTSLISAVNQIFLAKAYGSSVDLDFYLIVTSIPLFVAGTITASFSYYLTPLVIRIVNNDPDNLNLPALSRIILFISTFTLILGLALFFLFKKEIPDELLKKAILNTALIFVVAFFSIFNAYLTAVSNAKNIFNIPIIANMIPYICMAVSILFCGKKMGTPAISLGLSLGSFLTFITLLFLNKEDIITRIKPVYNNGIQLFIIKLPLVFIGMFCFTCYQSIDAIVAPKLGSASMSYVSYCQRLIVPLGSMIIAGPSVLLTTFLANNLISESPKDSLKVIGKTIRLIFIVAGSGAVFVTFNSKIIIKILFQRGSFTYIDTSNVSALLPYYIIGMIPMLFVVILFRALIVNDSLKQAAILGLLSISLYFIFSSVLSDHYGIIGIPLAYLLSWLILFFLATYFVFKKNIAYVFTIDFLIRKGLLILLLAAISYYISSFLHQINIRNNYLFVFVSLVFFGVFFFVITYILKFNETKPMFDNLFIEFRRNIKSFKFK